MKRLVAFVCALALVLGLCASMAETADGVEETPAAETSQTPQSTAPESSLAPEATSASPLQYGDQGDNVTLIQRRLSELGYYTGSISGNFLDGTRAAVRSFQGDYGLEETGVVDGRTEALILSADYRTLAYGDDGDAVQRLQEKLIELGYLSAEATGKYRGATETAVKAFQEHNGLDDSGKADVETQVLLFSGSALAKGASPTPTPDPETDLGDINDVVVANDGDVTQDSAYTRSLSRGSQGEEVKQVQTRLTELGFFDGPISGNYMNQTVAAVKAFQTHNGLESDGITGPDTWNMMFNSDEVLDTSATPRPTPEPTPVPYAVTVDVKNQVTTVYGLDENGEYTEVVRQMICSTGTVSTPSDVGEWVTNGRRARWAYFPQFGSHAQYWTRINENIAFHSVIYNRVDYDAMSVKSYNMLGSRASHGCVRLLVSDAKWVYENIREGVTVTITEDLPVDEELRMAVKQPALNSSRNGPVTTPTPTATPTYISDGMPPQPFRRLQRGSEGEDVFWLQMKLKELGYYTGTVTGGYYKGTTNAVKAFQRDNGLDADGIAGTATLNKLYADILAVNTPTPEPTPVTTPHPDNR